MHRMKRLALGVGSLTALALTGGLAAHAYDPTPQGFSAERTAEIAAALDPAAPRNVILIIGDGMDDSMITAARNYEHGAGGRFDGLDALPFTGAMTTYGLKAGVGPDYPIAYVSDSAPTASGWSTGKKTIDGRLSQGPSTAANVPGEDYETVLEKFKAAGKLVGNVSTAELTDATPAAAAAHINARGCQGPTDMGACTAAKKSNGGKGSVAEQLVDSQTDVMLGGGAQRFAQATDAGPTVKAYAESKGYRVVNDAAGMNAITSLDDGPVLGLFTSGNMTPLYKPLVATAPPGSGSATTTCESADRGAQPGFAAMTQKAIDLLDAGDTADKGFFLQAESAMIDKQEHASDICGAIGDLKQLDEAVQAALEFQEREPDTLIIVTGDHAHSTQIVGGPSEGRQTATLLTADGDPMTVAYSTSATGSNHTGAQIRVAASGPQAANVTGVIDQTDLFATMLGRTPSTVPAQPTATVTVSPTPAPTVTVTAQPTPAPSTTPTTAPTPSTAVPVARVAGANATVRTARTRGVRVAVAVAGDARVSVRFTQGGRTIGTKSITSSGVVTLSSKRFVRGKVTITVTATNEAGSATARGSLRITR